MERVILGLGSNKGDKKKYLENAVFQLRAILRDVVLSSVYQTAPRDYLSQDDFYNMVVSGMYEGSPLELLQKTQEIEMLNGRNRETEIAKGPRTLDIDILFFGDLRLNIAQLTIPHPAIKMRAFVLVPLLEIFPSFRDVEGIYYKDLLPHVMEQKVERLYF